MRSPHPVFRIVVLLLFFVLANNFALHAKNHTSGNWPIGLETTNTCCRDTTAAFGDTVVLAQSTDEYSVAYELLEAPAPIHLIGTDNHILIANEVGVAQLKAYLVVANTTDTVITEFSVTIVKAEATVDISNEPLIASIYDRNIPISIQTNYDGVFNGNLEQEGWVFQPELNQFQKPGRVGTTAFRLTGPETEHYNKITKTVNLIAYRPDFQIYGMHADGVYQIDSMGRVGYIKAFDYYAPEMEGRKGVGGLIQVGDYLYGMTQEGGLNNVGLIFRLSMITNEYEVVHYFDGGLGGSSPTSRLLWYDGKIWGTTLTGGEHDQGVLFSYSPATFVYTVHHSFASVGGIGPFAPLITFNQKLWGTTTEGGLFGAGIVFSFDPLLDQFQIEHHFDEESTGHNAALMEYEGQLIGCNETGHARNRGSWFAYDIDSKAYNVLIQVEEINQALNLEDFPYDRPGSALIPWNGKLYGTLRKATLYSWEEDIIRFNHDGTAFEKVVTVKGRIPSTEFTVWDNQLWTASAYSGNVDFGDEPETAYVMAINPEANVAFTNSIPLNSVSPGGFTPSGPLVFPYDPIRPQLLVSAVDTSRYVGESNPRFLVEYDGFLPGDTEEYIAKAVMVECDADSASVPGSYEISPFGAYDEFYDFEYASGTLTVLPKVELQVSVQDTSRLEGEDNPEFTLVFVGLEEGDSVSDIDVLPAISTEANTSSAPGTYEIALAGGHDDKYTMVLSSGTLTIHPFNVTSLPELGLNHSVYPVPFISEFTVQFSESIVTREYQVLIYSLSGTLVYDAKVAGDVIRHQVAGLEGQSAGVFILKIEHDQGAVSQVLIKE